MYISKFCDMQGIEHIVSASITEDQISVIQKAYFYIQNILNEVDHYIAVIENVHDFLNLLKERNDKADKFVQINRRYTNYLNSFYAWKSFHNHKKNECYYPRYEKLKSDYQKNNLIYGIAGDLRNYTTHNGFAIDKIEFDALNEKMSLWITRDFYIYEKNNPRASKIVIKNLNEIQKEGIEAYKFTANFLEMFGSLQEAIWEELRSETQEKLKIILNVAAKNPPDYYNTYIENPDDDTFYLNIGRILEIYSKRMRFLQSL